MEPTFPMPSFGASSEDACAKAKARLLGVELSDETLQDIGYFVD